MHYNTTLPKLIISEYGRNVQKLIEHVVKIDDDAERNAAANRIVKLMAQLNPHNKNLEDFKTKLWDHLYKISDYKLVVDGPYERPSREEREKPPQKLAYPQSRIRHRHYGKNVENMIERAMEMEDEKKRLAFAKVIGNYMKMVYRNWNGENVGNDVIVADLKRISKGILVLTEDMNLDTLAKHNNLKGSTGRTKSSNSKYKKRSNNNYSKGYSKNSSGSSNNSRGRRNYKR